jgi:hypothetical protein
MMNASPEPEYLMMFVEDCRSLTQNVVYSEALHFDLLIMLCSIANLL